MPFLCKRVADVMNHKAPFPFGDIGPNSVSPIFMLAWFLTDPSPPAYNRKPSRDSPGLLPPYKPTLDPNYGSLRGLDDPLGSHASSAGR